MATEKPATLNIGTSFTWSPSTATSSTLMPCTPRRAGGRRCPCWLRCGSRRDSRSATAWRWRVSPSMRCSSSSIPASNGASSVTPTILPASVDVGLETRRPRAGRSGRCGARDRHAGRCGSRISHSSLVNSQALTPRAANRPSAVRAAGSGTVRFSSTRAVRRDQAAAVEPGQRPGQLQRLLQPAHAARRAGADDGDRHARRLQLGDRLDGGRRRATCRCGRACRPRPRRRAGRSCRGAAAASAVRRGRAAGPRPPGRASRPSRRAPRYGRSPTRPGSAAPPPSRPRPCRRAGTASRRRSSRRRAASRSRCCWAP